MPRTKPPERTKTSQFSTNIGCPYKPNVYGIPTDGRVFYLGIKKGYPSAGNDVVFVRILSLETNTGIDFLELPRFSYMNLMQEVYHYQEKSIVWVNSPGQQLIISALLNLCNLDHKLYHADLTSEQRAALVKEFNETDQDSTPWAAGCDIAPTSYVTTMSVFVPDSFLWVEAVLGQHAKVWPTSDFAELLQTPNNTTVFFNYPFGPGPGPGPRGCPRSSAAESLSASLRAVPCYCGLL
ncbi:uncharacterized protein DSM5745_02633 [Aspergillus mulundensis]|uniref:Uncharacterized protein n=1 Tax=Aspergillus mulundensis TaxID=1810919 RepID=A0A3D8SYK9_9EURO|nr:hypothetical protein DSM5745_02633 [Aspergillus mulundensis]RDW90858.1 hypothetical protein DSM5745_02633 [Aspergillus mulundensis]